MGASAWDYHVPYAGSVEATYQAVQRQLLINGEYLWPWEYLGRAGEKPRPSTLGALNAIKNKDGLFWEVGTHSILDTHKIHIGDQDEFGAIRPLTEIEAQDLFGTTQPSATDFDRVYQPGLLDPLGTVLGDRWTGRCAELYRDGAPDEIYFWGYSGDSPSQTSSPPDPASSSDPFSPADSASSLVRLRRPV